MFFTDYSSPSKLGILDLEHLLKERLKPNLQDYNEFLQKIDIGYSSKEYFVKSAKKIPNSSHILVLLESNKFRIYSSGLDACTEGAFYADYALMKIDLSTFQAKTVYQIDNVKSVQRYFNPGQNTESNDLKMRSEKGEILKPFIIKEFGRLGENFDKLLLQSREDPQYFSVFDLENCKMLKFEDIQLNDKVINSDIPEEIDSSIRQIVQLSKIIQQGDSMALEEARKIFFEWKEKMLEIVKEVPGSREYWENLESVVLQNFVKLEDIVESGSLNINL